MTATATAIDYVDKADRYVDDVIKGRRPVCLFVKQACRRYRADLRKNKGKKSPFVFSREAANRACDFMEELPHVKGKWAKRRERIHLEDWWIFILVQAFGWLERGTDLRRFRVIYIEVPRKNAKSTGAAGIGIYCFAADGEHGAEVYSGATTEKQAWEVFKPARLMVKQLEDLQDTFGVDVHAKKLTITSNNSIFEPIIGNPGDGASPHCSIVDEYHEHDSDNLFDTMKTGMGAREQPLMLVITTAGDDTAGPCYALREEVVQMLKRTIPNDELLGVIYTIDKADDWTTVAALEKANPNIDVSVNRRYLESQLRDAITNPRKQATYKKKHLDVWVTAASPYFDSHRWQQLGNPRLRVETFAGERQIAALDLANKLDLSAFLRIFERTERGKKHYYVFSRFYLPSKRAEDPERRHYLGWVEQKHISTTEGNHIDLEFIEKDVLEADVVAPITEVAHDPWGATAIAPALANAGLEVIEIPQRTSHLSEPMKWIEALILDGCIHHDGNPVMTWMMGNVVAKLDARDNVFPRKEKPEKKIDGASALITGFNRILFREEESDESPLDFA